jgi:methyltransferase (TIGR00027 family)
MTRTDNDTWDLATSVGATATLVAAARAAATNSDNALINDPYAEPLVRAVGVDFFVQLAAGDAAVLGSETAFSARRMVENMAVRTKFFDESFLEGCRSGIRQAVILASGLDARAYRLDWPSGAVVYEIDQLEVVQFKMHTLAELGATAACTHRVVAVDLRDDWASALDNAGFDASQPTIWSAEGLLGYLPPDAEDQLLDTITELSAPGSRLALDSALPTDEEQAKETLKTASWHGEGFHLDLSELVYLGKRNDASAYLADCGWQVTTRTLNDLLAANGLITVDGDPTGEMIYTRATFTGDSN